MPLAFSDIKTEIYREIDEDSTNSYFDEADLVAYTNRQVEHIGSNFPARLAIFPITGDGTTLDFTIPEPLYKVMALEEGQTFTPPRPYIDIIGAGGIRTTLTRDIFSSYGFSFMSPDRIRIETALSSGETRSLHAWGVPGTVNATAISATTCTVTKGSATVTAASAITNIASVAHLNTAKITDGNGNVSYYVVDSTTGSTTVTLTEQYRSPTNAAATVEIGAHTYLTEDWLDYIVFSVVSRLYRKDRGYDQAEYYDNKARMEKRRRRADLNRLARLGAERFDSF